MSNNLAANNFELVRLSDAEAGIAESYSTYDIARRALELMHAKGLSGYIEPDASLESQAGEVIPLREETTIRAGSDTIPSVDVGLIDKNNPKSSAASGQFNELAKRRRVSSSAVGSTAIKSPKQPRKRKPGNQDEESQTRGAASEDGLTIFFREARKYKLLTSKEEINLTQRIEKGDLQAKEKMINANLRLVVSQARRYQGHGLTMEDLVQEGMLGLIRAVEKFDWRKGFKFSTYGTLWIRQAMQRGLQNSGRTIRLPVHVAQREVKVRQTETALSTKLGREPTDEEIAKAAKMDLIHVIESREVGRGIASLDQNVGDNDDEGTPLGMLIDSGERFDDQLAEDDAYSRFIEKLLEGTGSEARSIIWDRLAERIPIADVATAHGITAFSAQRIVDDFIIRSSRKMALYDQFKASINS